MRILDFKPSLVTVSLGRQGENNALKVRFPIAQWLAEYGSGGTFRLLHMRSGDSYPYEADITWDDGYVYWPVTAIDTGSFGAGKGELLYTVDNALAKSCVFATSVAKSLGNGGESKYVDVTREGA